MLLSPPSRKNHNRDSEDGCTHRQDVRLQCTPQPKKPSEPTQPYSRRKRMVAVKKVRERLFNQMSNNKYSDSGTQLRGDVRSSYSHKSACMSHVVLHNVRLK